MTGVAFVYLYTPFGGYRESGHGRECSDSASTRYANASKPKSIYGDHPDAVSAFPPGGSPEHDP